MTTAAPPQPSATRLPYVIMAICGGAIAFDGYDLVVYGATLAALRAEWGLDATTAGLLGSAPLVGMLLGALAIGSLAARWGRKTVFLATVAWFSVFMLLCAAAPGPAWFAAFRLLAGLGLGGVMPVAAALTTEFAPAHRRNLSYVIMQSGYPVGGVIASLLALVLVEAGGWRTMYLIGGLPLLLILPVAWRLLPESREHLELRARAGVEGASRRPVLEGIRTLFTAGRGRATVLFWAMSFCSLLFVYGINTWLPSLMLEQGHVLSSALGFLLAFNTGAIVGGILGGAAADRWTPRRVVIISFLAGALAVAAFTLVSAEAALLALAAVAGYGAVGTQTLINGWVTRSYPPEARTTGIGWSLGIGRLGGIIGPSLTGIIVAATGGGTAAFLLFAGVGVLGAALATASPRRGVTEESSKRAASAINSR